MGNELRDMVKLLEEEIEILQDRIRELGERLE